MLLLYFWKTMIKNNILIYKLVNIYTFNIVLGMIYII